MSDGIDRTSADDTANLSLGRSSLIGMVGKFSLAILGFAGIIFFYRELGPTLIGAYYTILAGAKVASQFQSGVMTAIQKRVSEVNADQSRYFGLGTLVWVGFTGIGVVMIFLLAPFTGVLGVSVAHLIGGLAMTSALGGFATANQFYIGIGNPGKANLVDAIRSVLTLIGQVMLLVIGFKEFGLIWGFVFGSTVTALAMFLLIGVIPSFPTRSIVERTIDFARWSLPNSLVGNIYTRLDVLVLWLVVGTTSVGFYQPAFQLTVPATFVASSISQSLVVKSSGLDSQGHSVVGDLRNGMAYTGLIAVPLFFGALAIPEALMRTIFGPSATAGAGALVGLALFQIFRSYWLSLGSVIQGVDRPDLNLKIVVITLVLNLPLAIVLVQTYGLIGVVLATIIAEAFRFILTFVAVARLFGTPPLPREIWEQLFASLVMFGVVEGLTVSGKVAITGVFQLGFIVGLGAVVYFLVLTIISQRFKNTVREVFVETVTF